MTKEEMIGTYVLHNKNGVSSIGKIKSITQEQNDLEYLNVQFENSEKKFLFPDIIAPKYSLHFLFVDKDVRVFVENLFREKYSKSQTSEPSPIFDNTPKKDTLNSDDKLERIVEIFDDLHVDLSTVIDLLFDKIIKEHSVSFLYDAPATLYDNKPPKSFNIQKGYYQRRQNNTADHIFNFEGGDILSKIGASWFVSYSYYLCIDEKHKNWTQTKSYKTRIYNYEKSKHYHNSWLSQILKMSDNKLNTNKINLNASEVKDMAKHLLRQAQELLD